MSVAVSQLVAAVSVTGVEQAVVGLLRTGAASDTAGERLGKLAAGAAVVTGAALVGIGVTAVKMAGDFQEGMTGLVTGAGESQKNLALVSNGILQLAVDTGTSTKQLTDGMFMIESAGFHGAAGLTVLKEAAMGAKVGQADLGVVADATTTVMKDYASSHVTAAQAVNTLLAVVSNGKTHMQDLAASLSQILPTAAAFKVSLNDTAGALATMTGEGIPAANAATYLRQTIVALETPSKASVTALKSIGLSSSEVATEMQKSLPGALQLIIDHLKQKFPEGSAAFNDALKNIAGGSKQMQGMLALTGDHLKDFESNVEAVSGTVKKGGASISGWADVQKDFNFKIDQAKEVVETLMIKIGTALLPVMGKLLDTIMPLITRLGDWIIKSGVLGQITSALTAVVAGIPGAINGVISAVTAVISFYQQWSGVINAVALVLLGLFIPALIKEGVESVIAGVKTATTFVANIVKAGIEGWEAAGKIGLFILNIIKTGAEAVIAGAKVVGSFVAGIIQSGTEAVIAGAKVTAQFVASIAKAGAEAVATGAKFVINLIPAIVSFAAEAIAAAATAIPAIIAGFATWAVAAFTVAAANIAAFWPVYVVIGAIIAIVAIVILAIKNWGAISTWIGGIIHVVTSAIGSFFSSMGSVVHGIISGIGSAFSGLGSLIHGVWDGIVGIIKGAINSVIGAIDAFIGFIDSIQIHIPSIGIGPIHTPAFDWNGLGIPKIPLLAEGGFVSGAGAAIVGEQGMELVNLPQGASVIPNNQIGNFLNRSGGGYQGPSQVNLQIDGMTFARLAMPALTQQLRYSTGLRF